MYTSVKLCSGTLVQGWLYQVGAVEGVFISCAIQAGI